MQKRKKWPLPVLRSRVPHQAALPPRPYLGGRIRKNEIGEENKGSRGNLRDRKEGGCC